MKRILNISFIISIILTLESCKKEIVEIPESNEPVFTVNGTIGNDSVNFVVGDDNSSFFSNIESINGVDFYTGNLINGDSEMKLGMYQGNIDFQNILLDTLINLKQLKFAYFSNESLFEIKKSEFQNSAEIKEIKWYVNDEFFSTNNIKIFKPGKYNVCAQITYNNQNAVTICNEIIVGYKRSSEIELKFDVVNNQFNAWLETTGSPISSVKWFLNEQLISEANQLNNYVSENLNTLKAEVTFANGAKRIRSVLIDCTGNNFSIEDFAKFENKSNSFWDYKIAFSYKNQGEEYTSLFTENDFSKFIINSVEFLGVDSNGNPVYIFKGILNTFLKSKSSSDILEVKLNLSWGIAIK